MSDEKKDGQPIGDYAKSLGWDEASDEEYAERQGETMSLFAPLKKLRIKKKS